MGANPACPAIFQLVVPSGSGYDYPFIEYRVDGGSGWDISYPASVNAACQPLKLGGHGSSPWRGTNSLTVRVRQAGICKPVCGGAGLVRGVVRRDAKHPCKVILRVQLPTSPPFPCRKEER